MLGIESWLRDCFQIMTTFRSFSSGRIHRIFSYYDDCQTDKSAGYTIEMLTTDEVDVILGPPCSDCESRLVEKRDSRPRCGNHREVLRLPDLTLGSAVQLGALRCDTLPDSCVRRNEHATVSTLLAAIPREAQAIVQLLTYFEWTEFALLFNIKRSGLIPKCQYFVDDLDVDDFRREICRVSSTTRMP